MRRVLLLSSALASTLCAQDITVEKIFVESEKEVAVQKEVTQEEIKFTRQSDLGEILSETLPEITHVRSSAIGNDLTLRGFKRDDITVLIDGAKVFGACPNRMDPPSMHVSSSQIQDVKVKEGPFDVANFGSLGGMIEVETKDPKEGFGGEISLIGGSYGYKKATVSAEGGSDKVKVLAGYSQEESNQYEDGDGKTMAEQIEAILGPSDPNTYKTSEKNREAYNRQSFWTKLLFTPSDNHDIILGYYGDRADDVLYPALQMDAQVDNTDMFNAEYRGRNLAKYSDEFKIKYYHSEVDHEMGTHFRKISDMNTSMFRTHAVESTIEGLRVENTTNDLVDARLTFGIDGSRRNWFGTCRNEPSFTPRQTRIPDVDTDNVGLYTKMVKEIEKWSINAGLRYDDTKIKPNRSLANVTDYTAQATAVRTFIASLYDKDYSNLSGNILAKYDISEKTNVFAGFGHSIRVPDARELYFINYSPNNWTLQGNKNLNEVQNNEFDVGFETKWNDIKVKTTLFYSDLKDYIYAYIKKSSDADSKVTTFDNIDAHIYGGDISVVAMLNDEFSLEAGVAYQRGKKDSQPKDSVSTDDDLAEIPPFKGRMALVYDDGKRYAMIEGLAASDQKDIDEANGEKEIDGWGVVNLKAGMEATKNITLNIGIDNIFDETYAVNNTYIGRGIITASEPLLLNEPGRSFYANLNYRF